MSWCSVLPLKDSGARWWMWIECNVHGSLACGEKQCGVCCGRHLMHGLRCLHLSACLSVCLCGWQSVRPSVCLSLSVCLSVCLSLSLCLCLCLFLSLSLPLFANFLRCLKSAHTCKVIDKPNPPVPMPFCPVSSSCFVLVCGLLPSLSPSVMTESLSVLSE